MPVFRWDKVLGIARSAKEFLKLPESNVAPDAATDAEQGGKRARNRREARRRTSEQKRKVKDKKQELSRIKEELGAAADQAERSEHRSRKKKIQQEIFKLESETRAAKSPADEPEIGALPDFAIIGGKKCGTTFLYHLLSQHPYFEPPASKELHFFDNRFDEGVEWYQRCFPKPTLKDGRWSITGEATPYMAHPSAAERMVQVVPQARLIVLLRNPVDRAFSEYHMRTRKGRETRTFEEAVEEEEALLRIGRNKVLDDKHYYVSLGHQLSWYLFKSIYVDQLLRWSELFGKEQMLILKSEDFFEKPQETLAQVENFLGLPYWVPEATEPRAERDKENYERIKSNRGRYEEEIDAATRRRLEEYFEPHNRRLYDFLGTDFGW